jgi:CRISPR/Cas system-associated exonuclease Cas4 (RecB family)
MGEVAAREAGDLDLKEAIDAILAFERCYQLVLLGFERLLWLCKASGTVTAASATGDTIINQCSEAIADAAEKFQRALSGGTTESFRRDLDRLNDVEVFLSSAAAANNQTRVFIEALLDRHTDVQRGKFDRGRRKLPWIERKSDSYELTLSQVGDISGDPRSVPGAIDLDCGIQLRGSIDVVERNSSGVMRVTDHKTGKADAKKGQLINGGKSLQPVLYALAVEKLFTGEAKIGSARLYFCTSAGGFSEHVVPLDNPARAAAVQVAGAIGEAITQSFLPAAPDKKQCDICDFQFVCGPYEERRSARKPQKNLSGLLNLRGLPCSTGTGLHVVSCECEHVNPSLHS